MQGWHLLPRHRIVVFAQRGGAGLAVHSYSHFCEKEVAMRMNKGPSTNRCQVEQVARHLSPSPLVCVSTLGKRNQGRNRRRWS